MDLSLTNFTKVMDEKVDKAVGVPDVTVLPGFVATSTVLLEETIDGGGIGVADRFSATSFAPTSIPPGPSMTPLEMEPTEMWGWRVADVARCLLPTRFGGQTPATPREREGTGGELGGKDVSEMDARAGGREEAGDAGGLRAPSGHPRLTARGSSRSSVSVGLHGHTQSTTTLGRVGTTLTLVTPRAFAPLE